MITNSDFAHKVPNRKLTGPQLTKALAPQLDALRDFYQGEARQDLSSEQRRDISILERDHSRLAELAADLKVAGAIVSQGEATPHTLELISKKSAEKKALEQRKDSILSRNKNGIGADFNIFQSGDRTIVDINYEKSDVPPELKAKGADSISYRVRGIVGQSDFSVTAVPQTSNQTLGQYAKVRVSTVQGKWRGEEFSVGNFRGHMHTSYTPMAKDGQELYPEHMGGLQHLTSVDTAFAAQVMKDLGVTWPIST